MPFELWSRVLKTDGEETRQSSYNPNRVSVSSTQSLQKTVYAAAGTVCRLSTGQDTVSQAHCLSRCTKRHRRLWAQQGLWAVHGPWELRVDACTSRHRRPRVIELEAKRCSLDSLGAFTDEHFCCPAVTRSMHSDDTHSQMWVGSD